jgi:hypothetical protein
MMNPRENIRVALALDSEKKKGVEEPLEKDAPSINVDMLSELASSAEIGLSRRRARKFFTWASDHTKDTYVRRVNQLNESLDVVEEKLKEKPYDEEVLVSLLTAVTFAETLDSEEKHDLLLEVLESDQFSEHIRSCAGELLAEIPDPEGIVSLSRIIARDPDSPLSYRFLRAISEHLLFCGSFCGRLGLNPLDYHANCMDRIAPDLQNILVSANSEKTIEGVVEIFECMDEWLRKLPGWGVKSYGSLCDPETARSLAETISTSLRAQPKNPYLKYLAKGAVRNIRRVGYGNPISRLYAAFRQEFLPALAER